MGRSSSTDISLDSTYHGDRPSSYNDVIDTSSSTEVETSIPNAQKVVWGDDSGTVRFGTVTLSSSVTESPRSLYRFIARQTQLPPRQYVHIKGFKGKGNGPQDRQTDFDFSLDLTPTLLHLGEDNREWYELRVVRDGDGQKVYRGGRFPSLYCEKPPCLKSLRKGTDLEGGNEESEDQTLLGAAVDGSNQGTPTLMEWCERFCRDPAAVKSFTLTRELKGFDVQPIISELRSYLRSLNYRGHIEITSSIPNEFVTIYSPHWINRLRNNSFVWWLCVLLQLWIVTLPVILLLEKQYKVVQSVWRSSRQTEDAATPSGWRKVYAHGRNEVKLADFWAPAVMQAAWDQLDGGEILTEGDLPRLQRRAEERRERIGWPIPPDQNIIGVGSTAEHTQASTPGPSIPGMGAGRYNFQLGWGGNPLSTSS